MKKTAISIPVLAGLLLAGCGGSPDSSAPSASSVTDSSVTGPATESEAEALLSESPSAQTPGPITVQIKCTGEDGFSRSYSSYKEAWPKKESSCEATTTDGIPSAAEKAAVKAAYPDGQGDLESLYGLCAESGPEAFSYLGAAGTPEQIREVRGSLKLCPDHPDRAQINKLISKAERLSKLEAEGQVFEDGVFLVGSEVKPGTYYTTDVEGCYWERTDANGTTIDNYFVPAAKRVQVTIRSSDYSFSSEGCGQWQPVN